MKIIDWKKVSQFIKERKPVEVSAGILNDWFWTASTVYENGKWSRKGKAAAYVTSDWATPGFKATLPNGDVVEVAVSVEMTPAQLRAHDKERQRKLPITRKLMGRLAAKQRVLLRSHK